MSWYVFHKSCINSDDDTCVRWSVFIVIFAPYSAIMFYLKIQVIKYYLHVCSKCLCYENIVGIKSTKLF